MFLLFVLQFEGHGWDREIDAIFIYYVYCHSHSSRNEPRKLASSELFTLLGGFISSFLFFALVTFIGNFQEACGIRTGWGAGESAYELWDVSLDVRDPSGHFPHRLSVTPLLPTMV
ncbi:hypothetical protein ACOSQ4_028552 [Xanthoceras sorbifolium]